MSVFELTASAILNLVIAAVSLLFSAVVLPWVRDTAIPWLTDKRLYGICQKFVNAAEKMAGSGIIPKENKNQFVINMLELKGIDVTPEVRAFIESAVQELDIAINSGMGSIFDEFDDPTEDDTEYEDGEELSENV